MAKYERFTVRWNDGKDLITKRFNFKTTALKFAAEKAKELRTSVDALYLPIVMDTLYGKELKVYYK